ncbi:site-specific integrase [Blastococcus sp. CT_GayMR20]|uniref:tyrosine-type recombinase/integrase n=1 Tax=Blastococcus sp. CT_GayMR20 TaxID=2559609 RepID=UPI001073265A|nr:site-specific integrase [Blastococcus sp. CT_GayMR20]TFV93015.1 site-specific integrase [Blastococcus sp. CT_GayMR20]
MAGSISTIVISDGTKRYRARYRDAGGRQHEKRCKRKVDAQHWLDEQTAALVTQTWTAPERGRITVEAWAEQWLAAQTGLKPSTLYRYRSLLRSQILPRWSQHRLADVTHGDVAAWVAEMAEKLAPASVRQAHRVLALILTLAVRDGRIPRNPATGVPLPRARRAEPRFLTREQVERLAEAAGEHGDVVRLLAYTGLRFGEMAALRVRRVDFLRKRLVVAESATEVGGTVQYGSPKTHQQRTVPIPGTLVEPLARRCESKGPDDLVLTSPEGAVLRSGNFRRRIFDPAAETAGLPDLSPHDLRHTAASLLVASGANVKAVQRMLGHASAAMTLDVYSGLFDDELGALAERMDAAHDAHITERRVGVLWARGKIGEFDAAPASV